MNKLLIIFLFFVSIIPAQENNKGKISLILNNKKIDLPITSILLRKENSSILSIRSEQNNEENQNLIALEFTFKDQILNGEKDPHGIDINIVTKRKFEAGGEELSVRYPANEKENGYAHYVVYSKGEKMNWDINSFNMKFDIGDISYKDGALKINGTFSGAFRSSLSKSANDNLVEIKYGMFEIII